jgi:predicted GIY-YIG superfamily endonuclease
MSIYKIVCHDNHFYIGSTKNDIQVRLYNHKQVSKYKSTKFYNHINKIGWDNARIEVLEFTEDYKIKEYEYIAKEINNPLCLNTLGLVDKEEQIEYNKAYDREYSNKYYYNHRESILQKRKLHTS